MAFGTNSRRSLCTLLIGIVIASSILVLHLTPTAGGTTSFTLFGRILAPGGWGFTSTVTTPGPPLVVPPGDTVTVTLNSADGITHNWGVDYNGNGICDPGEPCSQNFGGTFPSPITFSFTATATTGNYTYYCFIHHSPMLGTFVVRSSTSLFGRINIPAGWGLTSTTVTSPGPTITVATGATVQMSLRSADGVQHNWGVDYNGNLSCDPGEPCAPAFISAITFTFTATPTPGNYTYYCFLHGAPMLGTFRVKARDVSVTSLTLSRNFAYNSVSIINPIQVNITTQNLGPYTEIYAVYAKANSTLIGNRTVTVPPGSMVATLNFTNPGLLARGNYILTANATRVNGETNFVNNQLTGGTLNVRLKGDVNGDCQVDVVDQALLTGSYNKQPPAAWKSPYVDINNDAIIDVSDLTLFGASYNHNC